MIEQLLTNAIISSALIFIMASGFAIIYQTTSCLFFSHAAIYTTGAYAAYFFHRTLCIPFWPSCFLAVLISSFLGVIINTVVYMPLRHRRAKPLVVLLTSLGVYIVLKNLIVIGFGDNVRTIHSPLIKEGVKVFGLRITFPQIALILMGIIILIFLTLLLRHTKLGKSIRAVSSDSELAEISGIKTNNLLLIVFAIGSAIAGAAGISAAIDTNMTPTMGINVFMMGVVAVIVGGVGSIPGIALGALLLAMAQHVGAWFIGSQWQDAIAFIILIVFLLFKPEGFLGKKVKAVTV